MLQTITSSQASPEVPVNENFESLAIAALFGKRQPVTLGLVWGYWGGLYNGTTVADGTVTLANNATNYVVVNRFTGAVSVASTTTNWADSAYARLYKVTTVSSAVTAVVDHRFDTNGLHAPPVGRAQQSKSADYTFVMLDAGSKVLHPSADTSARTFTIPANASVAYPVGTELEFINQHSAGSLSIAITTDTMRLAGAGTTGTRTLAADGVAVARKVTATEWLISGTNLT